VQITLGMRGSRHDGVDCTTEGVSTQDRAEIPLRGPCAAVADPAKLLPQDAIARVRVMALRVVFAEDDYLVRQGVT